MHYFLRFKHWLNNEPFGRLFFYIVIVPIVVVTCYLWVLLPDRYVSSATVLVKESGSVAGIETGLLASVGIAAQGGNTDEQILQAFLLSPDLLRELENEFALREHYAIAWDFIFGLGGRASLEDMLEFYRRVVTVKRDTESDLLVIDVHAYNAEYAKAIADAILSKSENFINQVGQDMAKNEMRFAKIEIDRGQQLLKLAKGKLLKFQNQHALVSPDSEGQSLISIVYELEGELAKTHAELSQSNAYLSDTAPQTVALRSKVEALSQEIFDQKKRITGIAGDSADDRLLELGITYQDLILDAELAKTLYTSALNAYELARAQAGRQLKYLIVASRPQLPEKSLFPKRGYWLISWTMIFVIVFYIIRLSIITVREHRD